MTIFDNAGGRKFVFAIGIVLTNLLLIVLGYITEQSWVTIILGVITVYIGGNVAHHYVASSNKTNADDMTTETTQTIDTSVPANTEK